MSAPDLEAELRGALGRFLDAIDRGDLAALAPLWCDAATMYFPFANTPELIEGAPAVLARFERMFGDLAARHSAGPPYVRFRIERFACRALDARHALVTATLAFQGQQGLRTLLFRREPDGWRLLHVHASNRTPAPAGRPA